MNYYKDCLKQKHEDIRLSDNEDSKIKLKKEYKAIN